MSHAADVDGHTVGQRIGYTRVSTVAQTLDQQNDALAKAGVTKTFSDSMSGARDDRTGLADLLAYVRAGDPVVVWKLDRRMARNSLWKRVHARPVSSVLWRPVRVPPERGGRIHAL